jgi:hypothetical protein
MGGHFKDRAGARHKSAFSVERPFEILKGVALDDLFQIYGHLRQQLYFWMGDPTIDRVQALWDSIPGFHSVIDYSIVVARLGQLETFPGSDFGFGLTDFFPEIGELCTAAESAIEDHATPIAERAIPWLRWVARDASADIAVEAAIFLASRGIELDGLQRDISTRWYRALCSDLKRTEVPKDVRERLDSRTIALEELGRLLTARQCRFFSFRDSDEPFRCDTHLTRTDSDSANVGVSTCGPPNAWGRT